MWQLNLSLHHSPPQNEVKRIHASAVDLLCTVHTVLEQEISIGANADIAKMKREKQLPLKRGECNAYCFD